MGPLRITSSGLTGAWNFNHVNYGKSRKTSTETMSKLYIQHVPTDCLPILRVTKTWM